MAMMKEQKRAYEREWRIRNVEKARARDKAANKKKRATFHGRMNNILLTMYNRFVKFNDVLPKGKYYKILGYSWEEFSENLEKQFQPGMTWENRGAVWQVDHIKPLAGFEYTSFDDPLFREAWSLSNIRPQWRAENQAAGQAIMVNRRFYGRNRTGGSGSEADPTVPVQTG